MRPSWIIGMRCALVALLLATAACAAVAAEPPQTLTPEQRKELQRLLSDFRKQRDKLDEREVTVQKLVEIGGPALPQTLELLERDLRPQLEKYRGKFFKVAQSLMVEKVKKVDLGEVQQLRQTVLALRKRDDLTKEMIETTGDPALKRLDEMLVIDRQSVLTAEPGLQPDRDKLSRLGKSWELCVQALQDAAAASAPPPATAAEGATGPTAPPAEPVRFETYLQAEEELTAKMAMPMDLQTKQILAVNARTASQLDPEEGRAILACNLMRLVLGLNALAIDVKLCSAARDHSADMEKLGFFEHVSPVPGKKEPWDRAKNFGTTASGENIFMGRSDGNYANLAWWHSPGHHKNMLGDNHKRIGMGRKNLHFTELFGS